MKPNMVFPEGYKAIGLTTLESRLKNGGYMFSVVGRHGNTYGGAKKFLIVEDKSVLSFGRFPICDFDIVQLETLGRVYGFDYGSINPANTKIYVVVANMNANRESKSKNHPTLIVEKDGTTQYANKLEILGACAVIYDESKPHPLGGNSRIETDSEVVIADLDTNWRNLNGV